MNKKRISLFLLLTVLLVSVSVLAVGCGKKVEEPSKTEWPEAGVYYYDSVSGEYYSYFNEKLPAAFHGTGDIYASATVGAMMRGFTVPESLAIAVDFTLLSMKKTLEDPNHRFYGVNFEEALPYYIERINSVTSGADDHAN